MAFRMAHTGTPGPGQHVLWGTPISHDSTCITLIWYMKAHGYKNTLSLTMFGKGLPTMLKEYGLNGEKR